MSSFLSSVSTPFSLPSWSYNKCSFSWRNNFQQWFITLKCVSVSCAISAFLPRNELNQALKVHWPTKCWSMHHVVLCNAIDPWKLIEVCNFFRANIDGILEALINHFKYCEWCIPCSQLCKFKLYAFVELIPVNKIWKMCLMF